MPLKLKILSIELIVILTLRVYRIFERVATLISNMKDESALRRLVQALSTEQNRRTYYKVEVKTI